MSRKYPWEQWHWRDWKSDPAVRRLGMASRCIWLELLGDMWLEETDTWCGNVDDLVHQIGCTGAEATAFFSDVQKSAVCDMSRDSNGDITLVSRRRARDENSRENNRLRQNRHRGRESGNGKITENNVTDNATESESEERSIPKLDLDLLGDRDLQPPAISSKTSLDAPVKKAGARIKSGIMREAVTLVNFFNEKIGTHHRPLRPDKTPTKVTTLAVALLKHGYTPTQIKQVTLNRMHRWQGDDKMAKYLRVSTLWRLSKFDEYLGELANVHDD